MDEAGMDKLTRREMLRSVSGLAASLCLGSIPAVAWAQRRRPGGRNNRRGAPADAPQQQDDSERQAAVDAGWKAYWAGDLPKAAGCFLDARAVGKLHEWEYFALGHCLAVLGRDADALQAGDECYQLYRNADSMAVLAIAYYETGASDKAIQTLAKASRLPGADPTQGPYSDAYKRLTCRHLTLTNRLDYRNMHEDGQRVYRELGHYVCFEPRTDPWQRTELVAVDGAQRHEECRDANDNRMLKVWPKDNGAVEVTFKVARSPWCVRPPATDGEYALPDSVRRYLGKTLLCDPTTDLVGKIAAPLKGATRGDTVQRVHDWWWTKSDTRGHYRPEPGLPPSELLLRQWEREGAMLGPCGDLAAVACALLRRLGIAATAVFSFGYEIDPPAVVGGHVWPVYYEAGLGWVSALNGTTTVGELPATAYPLWLGESAPGEKIMGSHIEDLGWFWWACCSGPKDVSEYYTLKSVEFTLDA